MRRRSIALALSIGLLSGCDMDNFDITQAVGIGDANPPVESAPPAPTPKPPTPPPPAPSIAPTPPPEALKRNMAFDFVRNQGISRTHEGQIPAAVTAFNTAGKMKPGDKSVALWLNAIQRAQELKAKAANGSGGVAPFSNPGAAPGLPMAPGLPGAYGMPGAYGAPAAPGAPGVPQAPAPAPIAPADPRLVF